MGKLKGRGLPSRLRRSASPLGSRPEPVYSARDVADRGGRRRSHGWYNTPEWKRLRREIIARDRWQCQVTGVMLIGKHPAPNSPVVDHKVPHRGDRDRFFDPDNLQLVSKEWHDRVKQSREKRGLV